MVVERVANRVEGVREREGEDPPSRQRSYNAGGGETLITCHPLAFRHTYTMILGDMHSHVLSY